MLALEALRHSPDVRVIHLTHLKSEEPRFQLSSTCNWSYFFHSLSSVKAIDLCCKGPLSIHVASGRHVCGKAAQLAWKSLFHFPQSP